MGCSATTLSVDLQAVETGDWRMARWGQVRHRSFDLAFDLDAAICNMSSDQLVSYVDEGFPLASGLQSYE